MNAQLQSPAPTNAEFLYTIFGNQWKSAYFSFPKSETDAAWSAHIIGHKDGGYLNTDDWEKGMHFCPSLFKADPKPDPERGPYRRKIELHLSTHALIIDDIGHGPGSKISESDYLKSGMPQPAYKLETSPGNFQWGYPFDVPCTDYSRAANLFNGVVSKLFKGKDPGIGGPVGWMRLPVGCNIKSKYQDSNGQSFKNVMHEWHPDYKFNMDELATILSIDLSVPVMQSADGQGVYHPDHPIFTMFAPVGSVSNDWTEVENACPWDSPGIVNGEQIDGHSETKQFSATYIKVYETGHIAVKCQHGSCSSVQRKTRDYIREWKKLYPKFDFDFQLPKQKSADEIFENITNYPGTSPLPSTATDDPEITPSPTETINEITERLQHKVGGLKKSDMTEIQETILEAIKAGPMVVARIKEALIERNIYRAGELNTIISDMRSPTSNAPSRWPDENSNGQPLFTSDNIRQLLSTENLFVSFNEMNHDVEIWESTKPWDASKPNEHGKLKAFDPAYRNELQLTYLKDLIIRRGVDKRADTSRLKGILFLLGMEKKYHPFNRYLRELPKWDGIDRISLLATVLDPIDLDLTIILLRRWLIGVIAQVLNPNATPRGVLVLQGEEHSGKSRFLSELFREIADAFMGEAVINVGDKDDRLNAIKHVCVELAELRSTMTKKDLDKLKAFITRKVDDIRPPYGAANQKFPRRMSFCGSVNPGEFLHDQGSNTRLWVVGCGIIAWDEINKFEISQLWAQMLDEYNRGGTYVLNQNELKLLGESNESFRDVVGIEQLLLDGYDWTPGWDKSDRRMWMTQSMILDAIGWKGRAAPNMGEILKRLTGEPRPITTTVTVGSERTKGKWWPMPPHERDPRGVFTDDETAPSFLL